MFSKILVSILIAVMVVLGFAQPVKAAAQTNCFDYTYSPRYTAEWGLPIGGADIGDSSVALNHSEYLSLYVQEGCTVTTLLEAEIYYVSKGSKGLEIIGAKGYSPEVVAQAIAQHAHESAVQRMADKANAKRSDGIGMFISVILTALLSSIRGHKDETESFFDNERAVVSITVAICIIMVLVAVIVGVSIVPTKEECWPVCQSNSALGTVISLVLVAIWDFVCKHGKIVSECPEGTTYELLGAQANLDERMNDLLIFHRWICIDDEAERTSAIREAWAAIKATIMSTVKHAHNDVYACAYPTLDELETTDIAMLIDAGVQVHVHCSVHGEQLVDPDYYQCVLCCAEEEQRIRDDNNVQVMMVALPDVCSAVDADNYAAYKMGALALSTDPAIEQAVMQWHMRLQGMYDTTTKELPAMTQTAEEEDWRYACIFEAQGEEWQSKRGL